MVHEVLHTTLLRRGTPRTGLPHPIAWWNTPERAGHREPRDPR